MPKKYTKEQIFAMLQEMEISYTAQEHGAVYTMEDVDKAGVKRNGIVLKNLFLKDGNVTQRHQQKAA